MTALTRPPRLSLSRTHPGRLLPCGCAVAIYQTNSGETIEIIDSRGPACSSPTHAVDVVIRTGDK